VADYKKKVFGVFLGEVKTVTKFGNIFTYLTYHIIYLYVCISVCIEAKVYVNAILLFSLLYTLIIVY